MPAVDSLVCFALYAASRTTTQAYRVLLDPWDLTYPQYLALVTLWSDGDQTVSGLGEALQLDSGTLSPMLARMETAFGETARKKGVPLRIDIAPEAAGDWIGDKVRIGQILANLISNAVKFTDQGEVALSVDVPSAGLLRIAVRDSGMGMNEATLGRLFSP